VQQGNQFQNQLKKAVKTLKKKLSDLEPAFLTQGVQLVGAWSASQIEADLEKHERRNAEENKRVYDWGARKELRKVSGTGHKAQGSEGLKEPLKETLMGALLFELHKQYYNILY
jgi:hypothetical protein